MEYKQADSYKTSQNQIPSTYTKFAHEMHGKSVLDYGCGKYTDKLKEHAKSLGVSYLMMYDPYNEEYNHAQFPLNFDVVHTSNVLNVINDDCIIVDIINALVPRYEYVIFKVYQGDRTGIEKYTKIGTYQRNQKTKEYCKFFNKEHLEYIKVTGDYIVYDRRVSLSDKIAHIEQHIIENGLTLLSKATLETVYKNIQEYT